MKNETKTKISKSLKKYHSLKREQSVMRKGLLIAIPLVLAVCLISEYSERTNAYIEALTSVTTAQWINTPKEVENSTEGANFNKKEGLNVKDKIIKIAEAENFQYTDFLLRLLYCESRFDTKARNYNNRLGIDRGIAQINSYWNTEVTDEQADDINFAVKFTMGKINNGYQELWACNDIVRGKTKEQLGYNY